MLMCELGRWGGFRFNQNADRFNNRDVDNILSKKFKPSSSHILEIYFEKSGFHKYFRAGLLSAPPQVN